ncbi:hypothetical protein [Pseudomonas aeruginosa]|uniref:hypothetical protein n=1 Tax=Pseudomonas aeruginosa TaxID=287 RepID=UPI0032E86B23
MATEPTQPQEKTRDEEIREWNESNSMLKGKAGNSKRSGIAIAVAAVVACGFAYMVTHGDDETENKDTLKKEELVAASPRKVMDPPPRREAAKVAPVSNEPGAPADTPRSVVDRQQQGAVSDEERRRQQLEMQAQLEREKMLAARQRSAIFATAKDEGFDQGAGQGADGQQANGGSLLGGGGRSSQGPMNANDAFAASTYSDSVPFTEARVMENLGYKVLQGAVIEATLQPRAQSQLPGQICASIAQDGDVSRNPRNFRHPSWVGSTLVSPATFWRIELGHPSLDGHRSTMFNGSLTGPSFCGGYSIHKSSRFLKFQSVGSSGPVILSLQLVAARSMVCIGIGSLERSEKNTRTLGVSSDSIPGSTTTARR